MIAGARQGRSSALQRLTGWAMARDLRVLIVPGPEVALAHGLDVEAAGVHIAATPRDASVLLFIGAQPPGLGDAAAVLYAQMPRPRVILALGAQAPSPLPQADLTADISQSELVAVVARLRETLAERAFAASLTDFDAPVLCGTTEYVCPMHPEVVEDEPGTCPKCGMDLVAREVGEAGGDDQGHADHDHRDHASEDRDSHGGHGGHGQADHDDMGFMSMVEVTRDLPRSADGLPMDRIEVPFGPCFPGLPGGLLLTLTLDGDGVAKGKAVSLAGMALAGTGVDANGFAERLARAMPLAPASYQLLTCRAIERAAGMEVDAAAARARVSALERERLTSHLGWLVQLGRQLGFTWLVRRATALQLQARCATLDRLVALQPAVQVLIQRLGRTPLLKARLKGIGTLVEGFPDLRGPVARASGLVEDARQSEAIYRELGFEVLTGEGGDAWARLWQRLVEITTCLDLIEAAGEPDKPVLCDIGSASGVGRGVVESPRGRAELSLTLEGGRVVSFELDMACSHHIDLVPLLVEGEELGDALVAVGSLDLSPWEVIP